MKKLIVLVVILVAIIACGASLTAVSSIQGNVLHSIQSAWIIADTETSAGTEASALSITERTKKIVDRLIVAASSGDDEISILTIPPKWNGIRLRCIGITDAATLTHQIYLGTLGGGLDCELTYAGQLAWTIGTQQSTYDQITFTLGGADGADYVPLPGDTVTGNTSGETAVIHSILLSSGAFADADAAGTITYRSASGTFTNSETVSIARANKVLASNALAHAASDLIDFELADTLTITAKAWGSSWTTTNPADNTNAEAELDVKGADFMVIVTTTASVDGKLLIKGF